MSVMPFKYMVRFTAWNLIYISGMSSLNSVTRTQFTIVKDSFK